MQQLSSQLFQISAFDRIFFVNALEGLDTRLINESSTALNPPNQVLEERWINSITFIVSNQPSHQEIVTANFHQITLNPRPLLPKTSIVVSVIMGKLNHHTIDNSDVEVQT